MRRGAAAALGAALCLAAAGCAAPVEVRGVGTGSGAAAYDMRGANLASLQAQALLLCPDGHQVVREWQRLRRPAPDGGVVARSLGWLAGGAGLADDGQAQLLVQCALPTPAVAEIAAVPPAAPASAARAPRPMLPDE